ncbi:MAG: hypothetical protein IPM13_19485 [Phycisphaerales bacterium]|nr:hypothetical protein [Phycisphaerales bacterium]
MVAFILLAAGTDRLAAQWLNQDPPDRTEYVWHIYVDPLFGDDTRALADNPPNGNVLPLGIHPDGGEPADARPIAGVLQHAPFAFRTVKAAMSYALQFVPAGISMGNLWSRVVSFPRSPPQLPIDVLMTIRHVVIHCLPGLYGPRIPGLPDIDPASGLPFNGDSWPVVVPSLVSIQGTSALDTIFDARLRATHILEVADHPYPPALVPHAHSFIDSVTVRNARAGGMDAWGSGAGIYVHGVLGDPGSQSAIKITNCFITNNTVGIGVDCFVGAVGQIAAQRPRIVNNTIAWNDIGLWSGNTREPDPDLSQNALVLINNIFDSGSPPGYIVGRSGFEGVGDTEKVVATRGGVSVNIDFNAWEDQPRRVNLGVSILPNWPATPPRLIAMGPRVDLTPFTQPARRGCLYINDIFRAALGVDYSPNDFRLAPMVTEDAADPPGNQMPIPINPLVNVGIDDGGVPGSLSIIMGNTIHMMTPPAPPGLPVGAEGPLLPLPHTRVDGWDYDGEGWGNPRISLRPGFANTNPWGTIDLGADEMGKLIIAGFLNGTRILTPDPVPNAPTAGFHGGIYFFDLSSLNPIPRPQANLYPGQQFPDALSPPVLNVDWWAHVQIPSWPELFPGSNYTDASAPGTTTERNVWIGAAGLGHEPFMRNLECNFSPHLAPDPHPFWGSWMFGQALGNLRDVYASNPWYDHATNFPPPLLRRRDNPTLFHNFGGGPGSTSWGGGFSGPMYVVDATLNPPGTYPQAARWTLPPTGPFGPYTPCTGTIGNNYAVGIWGFGDVAAGCPDVVPGILNAVGLFESAIRLNCERFDSQTGASISNLQTFLGIRTPYAPPEGAAQRSGVRTGQSVAPSTRPTREAMERIIRAARERR